MGALPRISTPPAEKNLLADLQHALYAGVFHTPQEPLDAKVVMGKLHRLQGTRTRRDSEDPSRWEFDLLQRQISTELESVPHPEFVLALRELRSILHEGRRAALEARTQRVRSSQATAAEIVGRRFTGTSTTPKG